MIRGIHHVAIHTPDIDRLRSFYEQAFGFEAVGEEMNLGAFPEAGLITGVEGAVARVVMMKAGTCFIELFEWSAPKGNPLQPLRPIDFGYTHFCVDVADIDKEYQRLSELGMTFVYPEPVRAGPYGSVYGHDPDGNIIELLEVSDQDPMSLQAAG